MTGVRAAAGLQRARRAGGLPCRGQRAAARLGERGVGPEVGAGKRRLVGAGRGRFGRGGPGPPSLGEGAARPGGLRCAVSSGEGGRRGRCGCTGRATDTRSFEEDRGLSTSFLRAVVCGLCLTVPSIDSMLLLLSLFC